LGTLEASYQLSEIRDITEGAQRKGVETGKEKSKKRI